ncbi:hypothetical protein [uncultured Polaribacter sp.]|uniref:hypothetical protein n=1 Tax=uncultured Polaribacter sp. TaxID=174711 RepID=UPI0026394152|nr:hypothetical protein [uncultured Polaribacter sp.]
MNIQTKKIELIKKILAIEKSELLLKIEHIFERYNFDADIVNEENLNYNNLKSSKEKKKLAFINDFINLDNEETISKLEKTLWNNNDFWYELTPSQREEIEQADIEIINGETSDYETFIAPHLK